MKGITFRPELIQAIIDGRKTRFTIPIKPQPDLGLPEFDRYSHITVGNFHPTKIDKDGEEYPADEIFGAYTDDGEWGWKSPYQVGEVVYVKEAWWLHKSLLISQATLLHWKGAKPAMYYDADMTTDERRKGGWLRYWYDRKSPIFMPEWAARYFLEITDVRAERLQEINKTRHDEVMKEGYPFGYDINGLNEHPVNSLARYWNSINKDYPWESNPWVWVYTFKIAHNA